MTMMQTLRNDQLTARKQKEVAKAELLTTLLGEAAMIGKNDGNRETLDTEVIGVIKKFIKNANETLSYLGNSIDDALTNRREEICAELAILQSYMPSQIAGEVLRGVVESIKTEINAGPKDMGKVMGLLKARFDGQYDGKEASSVVKEILA